MNASIKTILELGFVLILAGLLGGCSSQSGPKPLEAGQVAPFARFTLLSGEVVSLKQLKGKPAVIVFWASTCSFSPKTVERINKLVAKVGTNRATFIAASLDKAEALEEIKQMIHYRDMNNLTHAFSGNAEYDEAYLALRGSELPYIVLVGADGTIVYAGRDAGAVEDFFAKK